MTNEHFITAELSHISKPAKGAVTDQLSVILTKATLLHQDHTLKPEQRMKAYSIMQAVEKLGAMFGLKDNDTAITAAILAYREAQGPDSHFGAEEQA